MLFITERGSISKINGERMADTLPSDVANREWHLEAVKSAD